MPSAIAVIGSGTWGLAVAGLLAGQGNAVTVFSSHKTTADTLCATRKSPHLEGFVLPREVAVTTDMTLACRDKDFILFAVPSVYLRAVASSAKGLVAPDTIVVCLTKGLEEHTFCTPLDILREELAVSDPVALSGPTHAEEVAQNLPSTIVAASRDENAARRVQALFAGSCLRVYTNRDVYGVELCGASKNIIAIAAGISDGLGYGDNAKAALVTRGVTELARLGIAAGCDPATFYGLSGIGDVVVTSTSVHSRNRRAGYLIGQGLSPADAAAEVGMVVEGINALPAAVAFAEKHGVEMPITFAVDAVIRHGASPLDTVNALMSRRQKPE